MSSPSGQLISSGKQRIPECRSRISEEDVVLLLFWYLVNKAENFSPKYVEFRKMIIIILMLKKIRMLVVFI